MRSFFLTAALSAVLAASLLFPAAAWADAEFFKDIDARLGAVENEVEKAAAVLNGPQPREAIVTAQLFGDGNKQAIAQLNTRMDNLESQMRQLTGQIDQIGFQLRQIDDRMRRRSDGTMLPPERQAAVPQAPQTFQTPQAPAAPPVRPLPPAGGGATDKPIDLGGVFNRVGAPEPAAPAPEGGDPAVLPPGVVAKEAYDISYGYISRGDYALAERSFREFLNRHPQDQLSGNAQFWLGETFYNRGKFREAADAYLKVTTNFATSAKAPDSLVKLGASLRQLDEKETACTALGEFGKRYPRAPSSLRNQAQAESQRAGCS